MSSSDSGGGACVSCLRRGWLLSALSGPLDYCARDRARLLELLALTDGELLRAVAGRRGAELTREYERFSLRAGGDAGGHACDPDEQMICRHCDAYPRALSGTAAPHALEVAGGTERLARLTAAPAVAIVGSRRASDYGMEMARGLARGLSASGVTIVASMTDGISIAAHAGALDGSGASIAVLGGGLGVGCPARRRSLFERVTRRGCGVSELPRKCHGRRWGQLASERIVVGLSALTVLVEAEHTPEDLAPALIARTLGRPVAAIPGRVTSPLSLGTHALLMDGASLVRGPRDVLELLYANDARESAARAPQASGAVEPPVALEPRLKQTLERVGAGWDTPDKLTPAGADPAEALLALSELELMGLLARGDGGRYVPRQPIAG